LTASGKIYNANKRKHSDFTHLLGGAVNNIIWTPSTRQIEQARITAFTRKAKDLTGIDFPDYSTLYNWSVTEIAEFWQLVWDETKVISQKRGDTVLANGESMETARWFPEARLNFAENLLRNPDDRDALVFRGEDKLESRYTRYELYEAVSKMVKVFRAYGIGTGDRVAAIVPNCPEAIIAMLAAASIGAVWSSCSPDFGINGVVDRFGQIRPRLLIAADGVFYNGKQFDNMDKIAAIRQKIPSIENIIIIPYIRSSTKPDKVAIWPDLLAETATGAIDYVQLPFNHPLYILYSSGTTGVPKCIAHGAGGTLLQHLKEHQLHCDISAGDKVFYFTTCGWMMWNWLASALASEAVLVLYDGSPFYPDGYALWDYAEKEQITLFGTSAKYIDAMRKEKLSPAEKYSLPSLRSICSTGSPLMPENFDYVYANIKDDICLASISGGTDIVSCFSLGNPVLPVRKGEIQCRGLGMAVAVFSDSGEHLHGEKGELVCLRPFPSMPVGFWNDPENKKYHDAYFSRFAGVWHHGDYVEMTPAGGIIIYGRSDTVLNPGGVRIGTAEIYRQVEQIDEVMESIVVGQDNDDDLRLVLFVRLRDGIILDEEITARIKQRIRAETSPRHVPEIVLQVSEIPRTKSGKITELAVRDVIHGREVKNLEALANPKALDEFASFFHNKDNSEYSKSVNQEA
jgi:acetoacetyl-CoA synthetase